MYMIRNGTVPTGRGRMAMIDRDKVIKGLERCSKHDGSECPQCPYFNGECTDDLMADALSLLKEQSELLRKLQKRQGQTVS